MTRFPQTRSREETALSNRDVQRALLGLVPSVRVMLAIAVAAGLAAGALLIAQVALLSEIVRNVLFHHDGWTQIMPLASLTGAIVSGRAALAGVREAAAGRAAVRAKAEIRRQLSARFIQLGYDPSFQGSTADLVVTATDGVEKLDAYLRRYLPQQVLGAAVPLIIACAILPVDPLSTVLLVLTVPVIILLMILIGTFTQEHVQQQWTILGRLGTSFLDVIQGLPTLLLLDRVESERTRVSAINEQFRDTTLRVLRVAFLSGAVLELMSSAGIGLIATVLGLRLLDGGIPFDHAFYVFLLTPEFYRPVRELAASRHAAMEGTSAAEGILDILCSVPAERSAPMSASMPGGSISLRLHKVTYVYPGRHVPALDRLDLWLPANTCTAVIGRSGSGKSTLINLLLRFMDPSSGYFMVNGMPLDRISPDEWRRHVGYIPQRPHLFEGTVRDNIRLARPEAGSREVERAAEFAGCARFIAALPHGLETMLHEDGQGLSAGEGQRIAIARAFLKDAPVVLLDEPTSALDPDSEQQIRLALKLLMRDRTVLIVAHRLNTIQDADRVVVLEQGRTAKEGSPAELLRNGALYPALHQPSETREARA